MIHLPVKVGGVQYSLPIGTIKDQCKCCGVIDEGAWCFKCYNHTCCKCYNNDYYCVFCTSQKGLQLTDTQQKQIEMIYSPGGFQFNKNKEKIQQLTNL